MSFSCQVPLFEFSPRKNTNEVCSYSFQFSLELVKDKEGIQIRAHLILYRKRGHSVWAKLHFLSDFKKIQVTKPDSLPSLPIQKLLATTDNFDETFQHVVDCTQVELQFQRKQRSLKRRLKSSLKPQAPSSACSCVRPGSVVHCIWQALEKVWLQINQRLTIAYRGLVTALRRKKQDSWSLERLRDFASALPPQPKKEWQVGRGGSCWLSQKTFLVASMGPGQSTAGLPQESEPGSQGGVTSLTYCLL